MSRRISRAARRYLLTGQAEPYAFGFRSGPEGRRYNGGRWGLHLSPLGNLLLFFFPDPGSRDFWVSRDPKNRTAIGKRHPLVKSFRWHVEQGSLSPAECSR